MTDRNQKKSSGNKLCINYLLYNLIVQHLLFKFFFKCTAGKPLLHCFLQASSLFHCIIKILVGVCMSGFSMCKGMFNFEHWDTMFRVSLMMLCEYCHVPLRWMQRQIPHSWIALGMSCVASQRKLTQNSGVHIPGAGHFFKVNLIQASAT